MLREGIKIEKVSKSFGAKKVLQDVSAEIKKGELFGLLGPSGAGKTTLIKIITGQLSADAGRVEVLGTDVKNFSKKMYTNFGMVLDNTGLYRRMSCYDNLAVFADIYSIPKKRITEVLEKVGLGNAGKTAADKLSKGMKQRLILARALLHHPAILFLDEPTSGLDPNTANSIHDLILEEKERGVTVFLTTHNMEEASKLCDNVALLDRGSMIEYGNPEEICRKYNHKNQIIIVTREGRTIVLENSRKDAHNILKYFENEDVESIHSTEPNLESVFMELTGRKLDQDEYE